MPTASELQKQLEYWLPSYWDPSNPITHAISKAFERVSTATDDLEGSVSIGGAEGAFLTLLAKGYGVRRATGEGDAELRDRLRNAEDMVTRPAILTRVNELLAPYAAETAVMIEHFESGGFCDIDYLDQATIYDHHNAFTLVVPLVGNWEGINSYVDLAFADIDYMGGDSVHPVYIAIMAEVERLRAAGVRWWLAIDTDTTEDDVADYPMTAAYSHAPADTVIQRIKVKDNHTFIDVRLRASYIPAGGTLTVERDVDGVLTNLLSAASYDLSTIATADEEVSLSGIINPTEVDKQTADDTWIRLTVTGLDFTGAADPAVEGLDVAPLLFADS